MTSEVYTRLNIFTFNTYYICDNQSAIHSRNILICESFIRPMSWNENKWHSFYKEIDLPFEDTQMNHRARGKNHLSAAIASMLYNVNRVGLCCIEAPLSIMCKNHKTITVRAAVDGNVFRFHTNSSQMFNCYVTVWWSRQTSSNILQKMFLTL